MEKLISVDFKSDFGFFRKPDANNTISLSYTILHKPALLGILGAIVGLDGYKEKGKLPRYFEVFKAVKVGVEPRNHEKGNFQKTVIKYSNTVGYANNGSTFLTEEATLIKPRYRVYLLLNTEDKFQDILYTNLKEGKAEYLPYFGKNEFSAWWEDFKEYSFKEIKKAEEDYEVKTVFLKQDLIKEQKGELTFDFMSFHINETPFMFFERLPKNFDEELFQYDLGDFVFTTWRMKSSTKIDNLYYLIDMEYYVQLL
ncbi:MAG: CRISPR-associated protein Cas5 [Agriterribacter sp.]